MPDRRLRFELSILALICTLGIFLVPSSSGPYSATHGPVTALRAIRIATETVQSLELPRLSGARGESRARVDAVAILERFLAGVTGLPHDLILRC